MSRLGPEHIVLSIFLGIFVLIGFAAYLDYADSNTKRIVLNCLDAGAELKLTAVEVKDFCLRAMGEVK